MKQNVCPYCGETADNAKEEIVHMNMMHPDIVAKRLRDAGMHVEADEYEREHEA